MLGHKKLHLYTSATTLPFQKLMESDMLQFTAEEMPGSLLGLLFLPPPFQPLLLLFLPDVSGHVSGT